MKVSREQAVQNRERVVETAARLFRERGYSGIGVADLMKSAGLTHGGFYGNFGSKEALMAEAVSHAIDHSVKTWDKITAKHPEDPLDAITKAYLSLAHRDHPGQGCAIAALGPEVARLAPGVRSAMTDGVSRQIDKLAALMPSEADGDKRRAALVVFASMVGALVMSRAVDDEALSEEFLSAVRESVAAPA